MRGEGALAWEAHENRFNSLSESVDISDWSRGFWGKKVVTLGEKAVNQRKHENIYTHVVHGWTRRWRFFITPLNCKIELEIFEVTSMGLCSCNLIEKLECSNSIHKGTIWHQIRISGRGDRQKDLSNIIHSMHSLNDFHFWLCFSYLLCLFMSAILSDAVK